MILKRSSNSMLMAILLKPPPFRRKWSTKFWQFIKIKLIIKNSNGMTADYKKNLQNLISIVIKEDASDLHLSEDRVPVIRSAGFLVPISNHPALTKQDLKGILEELIDAPKKEIFLEKQQGFFLVVGPTGHGKSTTLATMIDMINEQRLEHIITIEDPVEYIFQSKKSIIDQREVLQDTPDFHTALDGAFRQDIDVLMIGEMRTKEDIATAVTAAETGHLVFSTLHTNSAAQTIERIIDSFDGNQQTQIRVQLANSLLGVFSQ